jgi:hypothetical protein
MPNICPGIRQVDSKKPLELPPNDSMPNLKNITTSTAIELRLLTCIYEDCLKRKKYSDNNSNSKKLCNQSSRVYAHISFKEKLAILDIKHHLMVFIKGSINIDILKRRLYNTLDFLEIKNEKTFFHIVSCPSIVSGMGVNGQNIFKRKQSECNDELKKCFNYGYNEIEQICKIYPARIKDYSIGFSGSNPIILTLYDYPPK